MAGDVVAEAGGACTGDAIWGPSGTLKARAPSGCEVWALSPAWCHLQATLDRGCWPRAKSTGAHRLQQTGARRENGCSPAAGVCGAGGVGPSPALTWPLHYSAPPGETGFLFGWGGSHGAGTHDSPPPRHPVREGTSWAESKCQDLAMALIGPFGVRVCGRVAAPKSCIWGKGSTPRERGMLSPNLGFQNGS